MSSYPLPSKKFKLDSNVKLLKDKSKYVISKKNDRIDKEKINAILLKIKNELGIVTSITDPNSGTYGDIYFGQNSHQEKFVIKIFKEDITSSDVMNEISCLASLNNYVSFPKLHSVVEIENGKGVAIVISYCGKILKAKKILKYDRTNIALQFIAMYNILEKLQILHRDIKNNNICISDNGFLSLIDFGYARRSPFFSSSMEVIAVNRHCESLNPVYNINYSKHIDLFSIFNILCYIFNASFAKHSYHAYPITIESSEEQTKNIVYLLLCSNNTVKSREKIYNILKKVIDFNMTLYQFHTIFQPNETNNLIYQKYIMLKKNIPKNFYIAMKKILNPNPKTRISFNKFYSILLKNYPYLAKPNKPLPYISFDKHALFSCKYSNYKYLLVDFEDCPPIINALSYYRFFNVRAYFKDSDHKNLFKHILYIHYNTQYESIYPSAINFNFDIAIFLKYLNVVGFDLHQVSPYIYRDKMELFKWTSARKILFDYFVTIAATNDIYSFISPFVLCLIITILIYRTNTRIPIKIDKIKEEIDLPCNTSNPFVLNKNNIGLLLENKYFSKLVNKFYGYYANLSLELKLLKINEYYLKKFPKICHDIKFYHGQIFRDTCQKK